VVAAVAVTEVVVEVVISRALLILLVAQHITSVLVVVQVLKVKAEVHQDSVTL
jgi:hypothetical protein